MRENEVENSDKKGGKEPRERKLRKGGWEERNCGGKA